MRTSAASLSGVRTVPRVDAERRSAAFASPATLKTAFVRIGFPGVTAGNPATSTTVTGAEALRLFGLDTHAARAVIHVEHVADEPERRGAREVAQLDRVPRDVARHHAADADAAVHFSGRGVVVDAAHRARGQRERIGRRLEHDNIARSPHEERHAAQLLAAPEERADVAAQLHARVDEARKVVRRVVPERRADHAVLESRRRQRASALVNPPRATRAPPRRRPRRSRSRAAR